MGADLFHKARPSRRHALYRFAFSPPSRIPADRGRAANLVADSRLFRRVRGYRGGAGISRLARQTVAARAAPGGLGGNGVHDVRFDDVGLVLSLGRRLLRFGGGYFGLSALRATLAGRPVVCLPGDGELSLALDAAENFVARAFRQARQLAESQKAPSSTKSHRHPSPPTQTIGGQGRFCREKLRCPPIR